MSETVDAREQDEPGFPSFPPRADDAEDDAAGSADSSASERIAETDPLVLMEAERMAEAIVFASAAPVSLAYLSERLPRGIDVRAVMELLRERYQGRGVQLANSGDQWAFRTAPDLSIVIASDEAEIRKLSRAALEVLAIIAYHQPVTRAEIEDIRGVQTSKGTIDVLLEARFIRFRGRRRSPGRPVTFGTTKDFLDHFGLEDLRDLPGLEELKATGLLSGRIPANFHMPLPSMSDELTEDEDPITQLDLEELGLLTPGNELDK